MYECGNDIVVNELAANTNVSTWADGANAPANVWSPILNFAGEFDGNGKTIYGLYGVSVNDEYGMGLFAETSATANIHDLTIDNNYTDLHIWSMKESHLLGKRLP